MHLVVDDRVGKIVVDEVERRVKKNKPGEPRPTRQTVAEEIILQWKENKSK